jgi:hypothetical protein
MTTHLAQYFRAARIRQGLRLGQLARATGYRNCSKGANRIQRFEQTGIIHRDLLVNLAVALDIDVEIIEALCERDRREYVEAWEKWVNQPVPMHLIVRWVPGVYCAQALPSDQQTPAAAQQYACALARQHRVQVCLVLSRQVSVWIDTTGTVEGTTVATPDRPNVPHMQMKGRAFLLGSRSSATCPPRSAKPPSE